MIQINLSRINWLQTSSYIAIIILSILLFRNCQDNEKLQLANSNFKQELKISDLKIEKHVNRINALNDSLVILNKLKQREKVKIVTVTKEVEKKIQSVGSLTTKGIANYYQDRYKLPIVITKYGISLSDTIAKKNIVELVQKDGLVLELNHTKNILKITENQSEIKDGIVILKDSIISEKAKQIASHLEIEKNLNKSIKIEKSKKTFWKITAVGILGGSIYLLAK